ncbi:ABC transporter substrate-binding protein [Candidatus Clostridium stratigraminis]
MVIVADKTMQQLLSGNVDIGFSGPEQVLYVYNQQRENYPIAFAQLTQKDGSFLVSRTVENNFSWEALKGKTIIGGRPGGVPEMALEYVLKNHGIDKNKDIKLITNIAFETVPAAFKGGTGDYAAIFEPTASTIVKAQGGSLAASVGAAAGDLPYTCFYTTKNYMDKNSDIIDKFTRAIYEGQLWVQKNSNEDIAKAIKSFFPGTDEALIVQVIKNYKDIDAYAKDPVLKEENLNRLMDIIQSYDANLLKTRPEYNKVVNSTFADKAIKNVK